MRVGSYVSALVQSNNSEINKSVRRLSSGLRVVSAADDAAGLSVAEKMRSQILGTKQAFLNAQEGISMIQVAERAMQSSSDILQRMRELGVLSANGTLSENDNSLVALEVAQLKEELDRVTAVTEYNGRKIMRDRVKIILQVGANEGDDVEIAFINASSENLGLGETSRLTDVDNAIDKLSMNRAQLGGAMRRLEHTCNRLNAYVENLTAAESRIRDTDIANEVIKHTKLQILSEVGTSFAAQANQLPGVMFSLGRG